MSSLSIRARADLWTTEAAKHPDGMPRCNLCGGAVQPGTAWDVSHAPHMPATFGGTEVGVAHRKCNRDHGARVVTPIAAKVKRLRAKHFGIKGRGFGPRPMPCGRLSGRSKTFHNGVAQRRSGAQKHRATMAARRIGGE